MYLRQLFLTSLKFFEEGVEDTALSLQLRFWDAEKLNKVLKKEIRIRDVDITELPFKNFLIDIKEEEKKCRVVVMPLNLEKYLANVVFENIIPVLTITTCKHPKRVMVSKIMSKMGAYRGWIRQAFIRNIHRIVEERDMEFELISMVYELRIYRGTLFRAVGTANFWPKGVSSVKEAIREYLPSNAEKTKYYVFIKSIQFKVMKNGIYKGRYTVDRWGRITIIPHSEKDIAIDILQILIQRIIKNYITYKIGYSVSTITKKYMTLYFLEKAKSIFLAAKTPGPYFFNIAKMILDESTKKSKKMIILPIERGNPRFVSMVISRNTGTAAIITITYSGLSIIPAPGSKFVETELIDYLLTMFQGLIKE